LGRRVVISTRAVSPESVFTSGEYPASVHNPPFLDSDRGFSRRIDNRFRAQ
jgi:hypothetical protein